MTLGRLIQSREKREKRWAEEQQQREAGHNPMAASQGVSSGNAAQRPPVQNPNQLHNVSGVPASPLNPSLQAQAGPVDNRAGQDPRRAPVPQLSPFQGHAGHPQGGQPAAAPASPFQTHGAQPGQSVQLQASGPAQAQPGVPQFAPGAPFPPQGNPAMAAQPGMQPGMQLQQPGVQLQPMPQQQFQPQAHPGMVQPAPQPGVHPGMGQPAQASPMSAASGQPVARGPGGMVPGQPIPGQPIRRQAPQPGQPQAQQMVEVAPQSFPQQGMVPQPQQSFQTGAPPPPPPAPMRLEVQRVDNPPDLEEQIARAQAEAVDLTVFITCYRRPHLLRPQVAALQSSSAQPQAVVAWVNGAGQLQLDESVLDQVATVMSPVNWGAWSRFMFALEATTEYVLILDDDCIPGPEWMKTALEAMKDAPGVYAALGGYFTEDDPASLAVIGPGQPVDGHDGLLPVDVGIGGWLLKREWLWELAQRPLARGLTTGWDIHISAVMQANGIPTYVLPYGDEHQDIWGSTLPLQQDGLRTSEAAAQERATAYTAYRNGGWKLQVEIEADAEAAGQPAAGLPAAAPEPPEGEAPEGEAKVEVAAPAATEGGDGDAG